MSWSFPRSTRGPHSPRPAVEVLEDRVVPAVASGLLDPTFGTAGFRLVDFGSGQNSAATALVQQSDGKFILVGSTSALQPLGTNPATVNSDFAIARVNADGSIDTTFGTNGLVTVPFDLGGSKTDQATCVALQSDGKIVVGGWARVADDPGGMAERDDDDFAVCRLNANGTLDGSFGNKGKTTVAFNLVPGSSPGGSDQAYGIAVQKDGKIVLGGFARVSFGTGPDTTNDDFAACRLNANGGLDSTFGSGGKTTVAFDLGGSGRDQAHALALQSDGKIVLAGFARVADNTTDPTQDTDAIAVARLTTAGVLDSSFAGGKVTVQVGSLEDHASALLLPSGGGIFVAGTTQNGANDSSMALLKLKSSGILDSSFGTHGKAVVSFDDQGGKQAVANAVAQAPDGKLLLAGSVPAGPGNPAFPNNPDRDLAVARLNTDGSLDSTFSAGGKATEPIDQGGGNDDQAFAALVDPNGKLVVAGNSAAKGKDSDMMVARVLVNNTLPPTIQLQAPPTALFGQALTITVQVSSAPGVPTPTGTVTFFNGSTPLGIFNLDADGKAYLTFTAGQIGTMSITASYAGDTFNDPVSTTSPVLVSVNARQTIGSFDPTTGNWYLNAVNGAGPPVASFQFGLGGWKPITGDWNGDGRDSIGVFFPGRATWFLRNENSAGQADAAQFQYGFGSWIPVAGDWDGNGTDTIGMFDPATGTWYIRNSNTSGFPDATFQFGGPGWIPLTGDWTGSGVTGIGVYDPNTSTFYLKNSIGSGFADFTFQYGLPGWKPVAGDFNGDGTSTVGVVDPNGNWYLHNSNAAGFPDFLVFPYGLGSWTPLAGNWVYPQVSDTLSAQQLGTSARTLSSTDLDVTVAAALARLSNAGVDGSIVRQLSLARYQVGSLSGTAIATASRENQLVVVDDNAAGNGWYVDPSPLDDAEFDAAGIAPAGSTQAQGEDLLTAVLHGMGVLAGIPGGSNPGSQLMSGVLPLGVRRTQALDSVFALAQA